jgi:Clathrin adaptor complex small chain
VLCKLYIPVLLICLTLTFLLLFLLLLSWLVLLALAVCELDLVFSLHKSLLILFEMFIGGMLCESNKREVLKSIVEAEELVEEMTKPGEDTASQLDDGLSFQEQFQLGRTPGRRAGNNPAPGRR